MKRVMLLALLALGLPTAALANGVTYINIVSGNFRSGSITNDFLPPNFSISVTGNMNTITLNTSTLTSGCFAPGTSCTFSNGIVDVDEHGATLYTFTVLNGTISDICRPPICFPGQAVIVADLAPSLGSFNLVATFFVCSNNPMTCGNASIAGTVPEPSAFEGLFLGFGAIALPGLLRRKLICT